MDGFVSNIRQFFETLPEWFDGISQGLVTRLTHTQIGLIVLVLVLAILVLLILYAAMGRRYNNAMDMIDRQVDAIAGAKRDAEATVQRGLAEQEAREHKKLADIASREQESQNRIDERERAFADKNIELENLRKFHGEYKQVADAKVEVKRLISEGNDYVDDLKARAERDYSEIISHAQNESQAIRDMAQGMMARSHNMLKSSISRANEILEDAKNELVSPKKKTPDSVVQALRDLKALEAARTEADESPAPEDPPVISAPADEIIPLEAEPEGIFAEPAPESADEPLSE